MKILLKIFSLNEEFSLNIGSHRQLDADVEFIDEFFNITS